MPNADGRCDPPEAIRTPYGELCEALSDLEHQRWGGYMQYFLAKLQELPNGDLVIPAGYADNLLKLAQTPYAELSADQQDNDRREVGKTLDLIEQKWRLTFRS